MRGRNRAEPPKPPSVVEHLSKDFARFLNNVQNDDTDPLGSFLIENEWENYRKDSEGVIESLELAGFAVVPKTPSDEMSRAADRVGAGGLAGSGSSAYVTTVWNAMLTSWLEVRDSNLIIDIFSMALSRASTPGAGKGGSADSSFQRFRKQSQEILAGMEKTGLAIVPDEATPEMVSAGVQETAELRRGAGAQQMSSIGADPTYISALYENMVGARSK
jgi:hypothetical protein